MRNVAAITLATLVSLLAGCAKKNAADSSVGQGELSVSAARSGFTVEESARLRGKWDRNLIISQQPDVALYMLLHFSEFYPSAVVRRSGPVVDLQRDADPKLGAVRFRSSLGQMKLDEYLVHPGSKAQGMIVVRHGKIALEAYPGMRQEDSHVLMSVTKTLAGLIVALLEADGKVDAQGTIGDYVPALKGTEWDPIKVIDVLDMASGLDVLEVHTPAGEGDTAFGRMARALFNVPNPSGKLEKPLDVIRSVKRLHEPGRRFEYSSVNTQVLVLLAEAVEHRRWTEILTERVWSKMNAEGDLQVAVAPDGVPIAAGFVSARLRDLARFGMLYTPSWNRAARQQVVSRDIVKKIQTGGRPELYRNVAPRVAKRFGGEAPVANSRQWDCVFADGDFFKGGMFGQGLYVSPGKDLVIAWFSTATGDTDPDLAGYARAIARMYAAGK